jgi:ZIP family zinc transporter
VLAILIHNFAEGMAIGVGFSGETTVKGNPLAVAIGLQDVPEGLVVALAAGEMLFVVSHELIAETHRGDHQMPATLGVLGAFTMLIALDNALA